MSAANGSRLLAFLWWNPGQSRLALLGLLSAVCGVLLFAGGPDYYSPRSYQAAWSLGHDVTFFLWTATLVYGSAAFARKPIGQQLALIVLATIPLGLVIEAAQTFLGRSFSLGDAARDLNGAMLAIVFLSPASKEMRKSILRGLRGALVVLLLLQIYPAAAALADEIIARRQFPVLSDLETWFERSRWKSEFALTVDRRIARQGRASLRAHLMPHRYSGLSLVYLPPDWRGYSELRFSVFNTSSTTLAVTCRIHDAQHILNGEPYSDRFNERFTLAPGWNDIAIPLERVRLAPAGRMMDLAQVKGFTLFIEDLDTPLVLYIDALRLQ